MKSANYHPTGPIGRSPPLQVVYRPIDELKLDPANPRHHSKKQIGKITASIKEFGFNVPILIDPDDNVLAGTAGFSGAASSAGPKYPRSVLIISPPQRPPPS